MVATPPPEQLALGTLPEDSVVGPPAAAQVPGRSQAAEKAVSPCCCHHALAEVLVPLKDRCAMCPEPSESRASWARPRTLSSQSNLRSTQTQTTISFPPRAQGWAGNASGETSCQLMLKSRACFSEVIYAPSEIVGKSASLERMASQLQLGKGEVLCATPGGCCCVSNPNILELARKSAVCS